MNVDNLQKQYNLSREAASRLLKVSIRTLDRYVRAKKLSTQVVDGRIWLNREDLDDFRMAKGEVISTPVDVMSTSRVSIDNGMDRVDNIEVMSPVFDDTVSTDTYKTLYLGLKEELNEKQERLEIANYRVGQLENQLRNTVPMLEYHQEKYAQNKIQEELKVQLNESTSLIKRLSLSLKYEKFSKRIFLIILLVTLALQPLLIYWLSSQ